MYDLIISEAVLDAARRRLARWIDAFRSSYDINFDNPIYGAAFVNYLIFTHHPTIGSAIGADIDGITSFYNSYYWFQRFVKLYRDQHGYDAGLEQQAFKMLEESGCDVDLELIQALDLKANA